MFVWFACIADLSHVPPAQTAVDGFTTLCWTHNRFLRLTSITHYAASSDEPCHPFIPIFDECAHSGLPLKERKQNHNQTIGPLFHFQENRYNRWLLKWFSAAPGIGQVWNKHTSIGSSWTIISMQKYPYMKFSFKNRRKKLQESEGKLAGCPVVLPWKGILTIFLPIGMYC